MTKSHIQNFAELDNDAEVELDSPFEDFDIDYTEEAVSMMSHILNANMFQMDLALKLTKVIVDKTTSPMDEESILASFKRSVKTVNEMMPLNNILEEFS